MKEKHHEKKEPEHHKDGKKASEKPKMAHHKGK